MLDWLWDSVFPPKCIGCQQRGQALCNPCRGAMPYLPEGLCARCSATRGARGTCRGCRQLSPALSAVRAPMAYEGAARAAIVTLKFRSGRYLAPLMGEFMCAHLAARPLEADVIVPVPLTPRRLRERGFNQAAILAEQVAAGLGLRVMNDALRREDRPSQRTLSAAERADNLRGAFTSVVDQRESIGGKRVLIVDDVVTTGATVSACADTLAEAGARQILALAFARDL